MTVEEIIQELQKFPPGSIVVVPLDGTTYETDHFEQVEFPDYDEDGGVGIIELVIT